MGSVADPSEPLQERQIDELAGSKPPIHLRLLRVLLIAGWTALGLLKLLPIVVGSVEFQWGQFVKATLEITVGAGLALRWRRRVGENVSVAAAAVLLVASLPPASYLVDDANHCGCFGAWIRAEPPVRRIVASALLLGGIVLSTTAKSGRRNVFDEA